MKTAIFLPDDLFEQAERLARRTNRSRSQLYADALREYIARHSPDAVTQAMDRVVDELGETTDDFTRRSAHWILQRSVW